MTEPGDRVIALACVDPDTMTVDAYGAGVYAGLRLRPGHESVPTEGSQDYEYWADVIRRNDEANSSIQWSLDMHKYLFEQGEYDRDEYDQRCTEARRIDLAERLRPMPERVARVFEGIGMNPRIDLDEGGSVWGFECWWGPEVVVKAKYEGWKWVQRSVEEDRLKYDQP